MSDWTTESVPTLLRIAASTASVPDLDDALTGYRDILGYGVVDRGTISAELAASWGTANTAGARYVVLAPAGGDDAFIRLIEAPSVAGYAPLTTFGWNAFELIVDDVPAIASRLEGSPFKVIGVPKPLEFMPSIVAMQVVGPGQECLYFTMETGDRETSILPPPSGFVGRPFIVVCSGPDFAAMLRWYVARFALRERPVRKSKVRVVQAAQGLGPDDAIDLSAIGMRERGNLIELDGYLHGPGRVAAPRRGHTGCLPPGNALVTFEVEDLDRHADGAIAPPAQRGGAFYDMRRSCTVVGPAGELLELIEAR